jgi:xylulokinase
MSLVAGVDSSTQCARSSSAKLATGTLVREGMTPHPPGTEIDPAAWWSAYEVAVSRAGGLGDVAVLAVAGQQHGMICLDDDGAIVRDALLWNDTGPPRRRLTLSRSSRGGDAGRRAWAEAVGSVPVASLTVTKLRWLAEHEPATLQERPRFAFRTTG